MQYFFLRLGKATLQALMIKKKRNGFSFELDAITVSCLVYKKGGADHPFWLLTGKPSPEKGRMPILSTDYYLLILKMECESTYWKTLFFLTVWIPTLLFIKDKFVLED